MYLTAITTACCYCNFSLHFKQRLHRGGGVRLRWTHMDGEQLHCGSPHIKLESFVLAASREWSLFLVDGMWTSTWSWALPPFTYATWA